MPRFIRRAAVLVALAGVWAFAAGDGLPSPVALAHASVSDDAADAKAHYDLAALKIFNRVVIQLKDSYVDPKRIDPKLMLVASLHAVEKSVAEVLVEGDEKSPKIKVTVGSATREFDISQIDSLWKMSFTMRDVFDFISKPTSAMPRWAVRWACRSPPSARSACMRALPAWTGPARKV